MIVRRAEPLNADDVESIGMDEVLKLASIRECYSAGGFRDSVVEQRGQMRQSAQLDERIKAEYHLSSIPAIRPRFPQ